MNDLNKLASKVKKLAAVLDKEASRLAIETAEEALTFLTLRTPVDTSRALSNWQVSIGRARILKKNYIPPHFPGVAGSTQAQSAAQAQALGKNALQSKKPGDKVFLSNVAPYIVKLNQGWSKQAPAGFIEATVALVRSRLKTKRLKINVK